MVTCDESTAVAVHHQVLREAKLLSSLQHVCVVGYHTAWMEHVQPPACELPSNCGCP